MTVIALAVLVRAGKVLIQRRWRPLQGFVYEFPGGRVDAGETPAAAAAREAWEEVGIQPLELLGQYSVCNLQKRSEVYFVLFAVDSEPQAVNPARQQSFGWYLPTEIPLSDFALTDRQFIACHLPDLLEIDQV